MNEKVKRKKVTDIKELIAKRKKVTETIESEIRDNNQIANAGIVILTAGTIATTNKNLTKVGICTTLIGTTILTLKIIKNRSLMKDTLFLEKEILLLQKELGQFQEERIIKSKERVK